MIKILLGIIVALVVSFGLLTWYTGNLYESYITEKNNNISLEMVKLELEKKLEKSNEISEEFQRQLSAVDVRLAAISVRNKQSNNCVVVDTGERGPDGARTGSIIPGRDGQGGLSVDWLYDYAGRCEKTRQKTVGLQRFIRTVNE
tara:strand:+ start:9690 stop:10124 length:435 start_codon:yes stop_codon:yes gene_type:complete